LNIRCIMNKVLLRIVQFNFYALFVGVLFYLVSDVFVTVDYSIGSWVFNLYASLLIFGLVVLYFFVILNIGPVKPISDDSKSGMFIILFLAYSFLLAFVVFGSIPKIIHNFYSIEGSIELTIERKTDTRTRRECSPSVEVEEVTLFLDNHICVSNSLFDKLKVGSKVIAYGQISNVGIEINDLR
jgi:hypothetical protein